MAENNSTLCQCGCGQPTKIADRNYYSKGILKGQPMSFLHGHHAYNGRGAYAGIRTPDGFKRIHIIVAEQINGGPLPPGAEVHHIDGNKRNNDPANLMICRDSAHHRLVHQQQRIREAGGNPDTQKICTRCQQLHDLTNFYKDSHQASGIGTKCKDCAKASANESMDRHRTKPKKLPLPIRIVNAGGDPFTHSICAHCEALVLLVDMYRDASKANGRDHMCKPCRLSYSNR